MQNEPPVSNIPFSSIKSASMVICAESQLLERLTYFFKPIFQMEVLLAHFRAVQPIIKREQIAHAFKAK